MQRTGNTLDQYTGIPFQILQAIVQMIHGRGLPQPEPQYPPQEIPGSNPPYQGVPISPQDIEMLMRIMQPQPQRRTLDVDPSRFRDLVYYPPYDRGE